MQGRFLTTFQSVFLTIPSGDKLSFHVFQLEFNVEAAFIVSIVFCKFIIKMNHDVSDTLILVESVIF